MAGWREEERRRKGDEGRRERGGREKGGQKNNQKWNL